MLHEKQLNFVPLLRFLSSSIAYKRTGVTGRTLYRWGDEEKESLVNIGLREKEAELFSERMREDYRVMHPTKTRDMALLRVPEIVDLEVMNHLFSAPLSEIDGNNNLSLSSHSLI